MEQTRRRAEKAERQVHQLTHEVDFKNQELESIRSVPPSSHLALSQAHLAPSQAHLALSEAHLALSD